MWSFFVGTILRCLLFVIALVTHQQTFAAEKKNQPFIADPVSSKQSIRFYKANKQLQAERIIITGGKATNSGCNNFLKKVRIFKTLQIGFKSCSLYENKNCAIESLVPVNSEKREHHSYIVTEGQAWFAQAVNERGADVRSWHCGMELEPADLRLEVLLADQEYARLRRAKKLANAKLKKAQADFEAAKKDFDELKKYQKRVKSEAVAVGAIEEEPEVEQPADGDKENENPPSSEGH